MLLFRVQMDADENGTVQPAAVQAFDTSLDIDPITGKTVRGQLRPIKLSLVTQQKIADAVNDELGGKDKGDARLQALRDEAAAAEQAASAVVVTVKDRLAQSEQTSTAALTSSPASRGNPAGAR